MMKERLEMKRSYLGENTNIFIEKSFDLVFSFCFGRGFHLLVKVSCKVLAASERTASVTKQIH